jgi:DNA-binding CsgD family transcriptional regulator
MNMQESWVAEDEDLDTSYEFAVLREWESIQRKLFTSTHATSPTQTLSWRQVIDKMLAQCTKGRAFLYWEPLTLGNTRECDRFCEVRFKQTRYGFLGLTPGYLASRYFPDIPQHFAQMCALLLAFVEYQELIQHQLGALQPLFPTDLIERLTRRERDVLLGLIQGQSDAEMAHALGIERTTVHTHRKRLYHRLGVHSAQEAILRCFTHRLVDWLDKPEAEKAVPLALVPETQMQKQEALMVPSSLRKR